MSNAASPDLSITIYRHTCQALNPHRFRKRIAQWRQVFVRAYLNSYMPNLLRSFSKVVTNVKSNVIEKMFLFQTSIINSIIEDG